MWQRLFIAPWLVFGVWWLIRARGNAEVARHESRASRLSYVLIFALATVLLTFSHRLWPERLWPSSRALAVSMLALEVAGIAFAIFAREHLGRMWSGTVTLKEGHRIIRSGPYRIVRHPIYTGILTGIVAVVVVRGQLAGLFALPLFVLGLLRKIQLEERVLTEHFGDEYQQYRKEVSALIPFVW